MRQLTTQAIVLSRTDFGEADRILTLLTPDQGKLRLMAKGVRRVKSKLAGGIELFSISDIVYIRGRGDIGTLVSTRLIKHYAGIVKDVNRTLLGYELIKQLGKATEDEPEAEYFELMEQAFAALENPAVSVELTRVWFQAQLLRLSGHTPNLTHEASGERLAADKHYEFSFEDSAFVPRAGAPYGADDIKFLRLLFSGSPPEVLAKVAEVNRLVAHIGRLVQIFEQNYMH